jgi:hypothetical protein
MAPTEIMAKHWRIDKSYPGIEGDHSHEKTTLNQILKVLDRKKLTS